MIDEKMLALLHGELDGSLTDKERKILDDYLAGSQEGRKYLHEMRELAGILNHAPFVEPPAHLEQSILNSVRMSTVSARHRAKFSILETLFPTRTVRFAYVAAVCAGLIIGIFGYISVMSIHTESITPAEISGSISTADLVKNWKIEGESPILAPSVEGSLVVRSADDYIVAVLSLRTPARLDVHLKFDDQQAALFSISRKNATEFPMSSTLNGVDIQHQGENTYTVVFYRKSTHKTGLNAELNDGGKIIWQSEVPIAGVKAG